MIGQAHVVVEGHPVHDDVARGHLEVLLGREGVGQDLAGVEHDPARLAGAPGAELNPAGLGALGSAGRRGAGDQERSALVVVARQLGVRVRERGLGVWVRGRAEAGLFSGLGDGTRAAGRGEEAGLGQELGRGVGPPRAGQEPAQGGVHDQERVAKSAQDTLDARAVRAESPAKREPEGDGDQAAQQASPERAHELLGVGEEEHDGVAALGAQGREADADPGAALAEVCGRLALDFTAARDVGQGHLAARGVVEDLPQGAGTLVEAEQGRADQERGLGGRGGGWSGGQGLSAEAGGEGGQGRGGGPRAPEGGVAAEGFAEGELAERTVVGGRKAGHFEGGLDPEEAVEALLEAEQEHLAQLAPRARSAGSARRRQPGDRRAKP